MAFEAKGSRCMAPSMTRRGRSRKVCFCVTPHAYSRAPVARGCCRETHAYRPGAGLKRTRHADARARRACRARQVQLEPWVVAIELEHALGGARPKADHGADRRDEGAGRIQHRCAQRVLAPALRLAWP